MFVCSFAWNNQSSRCLSFEKFSPFINLSYNDKQTPRLDLAGISFLALFHLSFYPRKIFSEILLSQTQEQNNSYLAIQETRIDYSVFAL